MTAREQINHYVFELTSQQCFGRRSVYVSDIPDVSEECSEGHSVKMSKSRGQILVELATRKKTGDATDSTSSSNNQKNPSKELKLLPSSSSQETSQEKPSSLPKPGEVWKPYDFEHGSFLKMEDKESVRSLIDWFNRQSSAADCGASTIGTSTACATADHQNLEELHHSSAEIHFLNSSDSHRVEIKTFARAECIAEIPQAPRPSPDNKNDINNSNDPTVPRSDPAATDHPNPEVADEIHQSSGPGCTAAMQQEPHRSPDTTKEDPKIECGNNSKDSTVPRSGTAAADHPNLEEKDEIPQPSVPECTAELKQAPHGSPDTKNVANDCEIECGEKSKDPTGPHSDPAAGDHPNLEESHTFPVPEKSLREYYNKFSQDILATAEPHDDEEADDLPKLPERQRNENQTGKQHDSPLIVEANNATGTDCNDRQSLHGQQSDDDTYIEGYEPRELQNLDDSDDPDYEAHSSDLNDSADELLPTINEKRKKHQNEGEKLLLEFSQPCCSSDPNPDPHQEENGASKRKVENPHERDKNTRKRMRDDSSWLHNKAKKNRNTGQAYWSGSTKTHHPGKALKDGCDREKCKLKCQQKVPLEKRQAIFSRFWQIGELQGQREYVRGLLSEVKSPLDVNPARKRTLNFAFHCIVDDKKVRVCKKFFLDTLGISNRCISTIRDKTTDGILQPDLRGRHDNRNQVDPTILDDMRDHIKMIPRLESHYLRAQTTREFISGGKTISGIYRDYVLFSKEKGRQFGSEDKFRRIFATEFNLSFFIPKKDQCDFCCAYNNLSPEEKDNRKEDYELHQRKKEIARLQKEEDKKNTASDVIVCTYDLQKSLENPCGDVSQFYYKSRLSTYNFTIYELKTKQGYCNVWHEGEGKRGSIEIGTCVFKYIEGKVKATPGDEPLHFIFYSDNCSGQQKNKFLIAMYLCASIKFPRVASITHKFLVTGHTQNEGDNMHSIIEKEIALARKRGPIYVPAQYVQLMRTAKKTPPFYEITEFTHGDFIDFKSLQKCIGENFNINCEGQKVPFSKIVETKVTKEKPFSFYYRLSFEEDLKEIAVNVCTETGKPENDNLLQAKKRRSSRNTTTMKNNSNHSSPEVMTIENRMTTIIDWNKPAYNEPCGIPQNTHKALQSLLNQNLIPSAYKTFFSALTVRPPNTTTLKKRKRSIDSDDDGKQSDLE